MWNCSNCEESVEDGFDVCWNCGTSREGTRDPAFVREDDVSPAQPTLEMQIADRFKCCKCEHEDAVVKRIATTGVGFSKLIDVQHNQFIAVSCEKCGYAELYNAEILGSRTGVGDILDFLFGR